MEHKSKELLNSYNSYNPSFFDNSAFATVHQLLVNCGLEKRSSILSDVVLFRHFRLNKLEDEQNAILERRKDLGVQFFSLIKSGTIHQFNSNLRKYLTEQLKYENFKVSFLFDIQEKVKDEEKLKEIYNLIKKEIGVNVFPKQNEKSISNNFMNEINKLDDDFIFIENYIQISISSENYVKFSEIDNRIRHDKPFWVETYPMQTIISVPANEKDEIIKKLKEHNCDCITYDKNVEKSNEDKTSGNTIYFYLS